LINSVEKVNGEKVNKTKMFNKTSQGHQGRKGKALDK